MKFTIDRKKWLRGEVDSQLLRHDGKQCCQGMVAEQCGVPRAAILNVSALHKIDEPHREHISPFLDGSQDGSPDWVFDAYRINDDTTIDDATREQKLSALFAANGHELEFVG